MLKLDSGVKEGYSEAEAAAFAKKKTWRADQSPPPSAQIPPGLDVASFGAVRSSDSGPPPVAQGNEVYRDNRVVAVVPPGAKLDPNQEEFFRMRRAAREKTATVTSPNDPDPRGDPTIAALRDADRPPAIAPPSCEVMISRKDLGALAAKYHDVVITPLNIVLVYDRRFPYGMQYVPPVDPDRPFNLRYAGVDYSVMSLGQHYQIGYTDHVTLIIQPTPAPEPLPQTITWPADSPALDREPKAQSGLP